MEDWNKTNWAFASIGQDKQHMTQRINRGEIKMLQAWIINGNFGFILKEKKKKRKRKHIFLT